MNKNGRLKTIEQKKTPPMFETSSFFQKKRRSIKRQLKRKTETKFTKIDD